MVFLYFLLLICQGRALEVSQYETMGDITRFGFYGVVMIMLFLGPLAQFKTASLNSLWIMVSFVLYTRWFGVMSIDASQYFYAFTVNAAKVTSPRDLFGWTEGKALSQWRMTGYGIDNALFLRNSEQMLIVLATVGLLVLAFIVLGRGDEGSCFASLRKRAQYSLLILAALFTFEDLTVYALLQLQGVQFSSGITSLSSVASILYLISAGVFVCLIPYILYRNLASIQKNDAVACAKWNILIEGMKPSLSFTGYQLYSVFLFQRIIASGVFVFLYNYGTVQVLVLLSMETCVLAWFLLIRPYSSWLDNITHAVAQTCVCLLLMFMCCFLKSWDDQEQNLIVLAYVAVYWCGVGVCLFRFAAALYGSTKVQTTQETEESKTDIKLDDEKNPKALREDRTRDTDARIISQLPNEHYNKLLKNAKVLQGKSTGKVIPSMSDMEETSQDIGWTSGVDLRKRP